MGIPPRGMLDEYIEVSSPTISNRGEGDYARTNLSNAVVSKKFYAKVESQSSDFGRANDIITDSSLVTFQIDRVGGAGKIKVGWTVQWDGDNYLIRNIDKDKHTVTITGERK